MRSSTHGQMEQNKRKGYIPMSITATQFALGCLAMIAAAEAYKATNTFFDGNITFKQAKKAASNCCSWFQAKAVAAANKYKARNPDATPEQCAEHVEQVLTEAAEEKAAEANA